MRSKVDRSARMRAGLLAGVVVSVLALPGAANAQEGDAGPGGEADAEPVDAIIVTAQRREQRTLDVGINISVADAEALQAQRIDDAAALRSIAPNISIKENVPGLVPVVTIRGVGLNDFSATNNPSAGIYVDEVSLSSLALMNFDFFDIARVEVLKGPQGTLYGRTATAGAINIISARPDFAGVSGFITGTLGNFDTREIEGAINLPVSDTLSLRFSGKGIFQEEGFYFNEQLGRDIGRRNVGLGRAQLLWEPTDRLELLLKAELQHTRSELGGAEFFGAVATPQTPAGVPCPGSPECSDFLGYFDLDGDPFRGSYSVDPAFDADQLNLTARIAADLGFATLTSITGFIDFDRQWSADTDAGPFAQLDFANTDNVEQFSQELQLAGETGPASWQVGVFYSKDDIRSTFAGDLSALLNTTTFTSSDQESEQAAIFGQVEWSLSETVTAITGIRYTDESRTNVGGTTDLVSLAPASFLSMAPFGSAPVPLAVSDARIDDDYLSWKIGLNWQPSRDMLLFGSVTQSFKSGGFFAGVATNSAQLQPYLPERIIAYEVGAKGEWRDAGLRYSASAFYYDYNDVQTFIREDVGGLPVQRLGNVDTADIYGFDLETSWSPRFFDGFTLDASIGLLDTRLGAFDTAAGPIPEGNELPDAPTFSLNTGASYEFDISSALSAKLAFFARYEGDAFKDALNDPIIAVDGFWLLDARATVFAGEDFDVSIWGNNLADERFVTQGVNQLPFGFGFRVFGPPRTYGITLTKRFN